MANTKTHEEDKDLKADKLAAAKEKRDAAEQKEQQEKRSYITSAMKEEAAKYGVEVIKGQTSDELEERIHNAKYGIRTHEDRVAYENAKKEGAYRFRDDKSDGIDGGESFADEAQVKKWLKRHIDKGLAVTFTDNGGEMRFQGKEDSFNFGYGQTALVAAATRLLNPDTVE